VLIEEGKLVVRRQGFAIVELLVVVVTVATVVAVGVFAFEQISTAPVDRTCSKEAKAFATEVQVFAAKNHYMPGTEHITRPSVYSAALALLQDGETDGVPAHTRYGDKANQWQYNPKTGQVKPGPSCT
jgi:Tfp pilus assembly protein PilE